MVIPGTDAVIVGLEDADYDGHSLAHAQSDCRRAEAPG